MIQFPETAQVEWQTVADAANVEHELRKRIRRDTAVETETEKLRVRHAANTMFQQEIDAEATPVLEMMTLANYKADPGLVPADMIEGVVKQEGLTIMLGPSGSGKSTAALQMLHSLMTGDDWLGQTTKPITGAVGIASYDMDAAMVMDWMDGYPNIDADKVSVVNAYKRGNPLGVPAMRSKIAAHWKHLGVEVVLIDSFSATFFGTDQNSTAETMAHYRDLKMFALTEVGARALIVVVHSTESSPLKPRGSSVHNDVADSIVAVWAPNGPLSSRHVEMVKYRAARGQKQMPPSIIGAPDDVTHLVSLDYAEMALAGMHLPADAVALAFDDLPDTHQAPDTDSDSDSGEDMDL